MEPTIFTASADWQKHAACHKAVRDTYDTYIDEGWYYPGNIKYYGVFKILPSAMHLEAILANVFGPLDSKIKSKKSCADSKLNQSQHVYSVTAQISRDRHIITLVSEVEMAGLIEASVCEFNLGLGY